MMATSVIDDRLNNANKVNWLKGDLVMEITNEAIRPFVETEITKFHCDIKSNFKHGSVCGRCMSTNASHCSSRICSAITSQIKSVHRYSQPCYINSDITKWLSDPWEIAKCYMSKSKDLEGKPGSDIELPSVLNVVINNTRFQNLITAVDMTNENNIFCKGKNARNKVMHSQSHRITAHDLNHYCDIFINIVNEIGTDKAECVRKIEKVRDTPLSITAEDIVKLKEQAARGQELAEVGITELKKKWREEIKKVESLIPSFIDGCKESLCRLTVEHIQRQKPERTTEDGWTVETFLKILEVLPDKKNLSVLHREMLFPKSGSPLDIDQWDIYLYCFILNIKLHQQLDDMTLLYIKDVKLVRDHFIADPSGVYKSELLNLCEHLNNPLKDDILVIFKRELAMTDMVDAKNVLQTWKTEEDKGGEARSEWQTPGDGREYADDTHKEVKKDYREELIDVKEHSKEKRTNENELAAKSVRITAKLDEVDKKVENLTQQLEDKVVVSKKQLEDMFRRWQRDPTNDVQELEISRYSCEDTDDQSTEDWVCKERECRYHTTNLLVNERMSGNSRHNTSAGAAGGGESSGDDSSSESDSESLSKHEKRKPSDKKLHRIKNIKQWDDAIKEKDEEAIRELLKAGNLPNSSQIRDAFKVFGRESGTMKRICRDVSRSILNRDDRIVRVEPAYESPGEDDVTFIIYLKQPKTESNIADLEFKVVSRVIGQYSSEGKDIVDREVREHLQFTLEEAHRLRTCLEKHSKQLMEKHSNLQMTSASHFKSKNYGKENLKETMCVVLYVRVKGCIPLTEEHLPNKLDEIPTDIREGGFEFLLHAGETHKHLKMGCKIAASEVNGTIGPFLEKDGKTYCLTAAHVCVGPPAVNTILKSMEYEGQDLIQVYQPNPTQSNSELMEPFGSVHRFRYKKGGGDVPGIDAATILIQDVNRLPNSGEFPESAIIKENQIDVDDDAVQDLKYTSGEVCDPNFYKSDTAAVEVLKFGAVTGATRGLLHFVGTSVRYDNMLALNGINWELHTQIEISRSVEGQDFADHGDSGALVLVPYGGNRNDLRALGLLIGKSTTGRILATPMHAILKEFGFTNSHVVAFPKRNVDPSISVNSGCGQAASSTQADIQRPSEETFIKDKFESIEKAMTDNKNEINKKVDALNTNFSTAFDRLSDQNMKIMQMMPNHKSNASEKN